MKHHAATKPTGDIRAKLRDDPALRAIYKAKTPAALDTLIAGMNAAQRQAALEGLLRLAWVQLRKL